MSLDSSASPAELGSSGRPKVTVESVKRLRSHTRRMRQTVAEWSLTPKRLFENYHEKEKMEVEEGCAAGKGEEASMTSPLKEDEDVENRVPPPRQSIKRQVSRTKKLNLIQTPGNGEDKDGQKTAADTLPLASEPSGTNNSDGGIVKSSEDRLTLPSEPSDTSNNEGGILKTSTPKEEEASPSDISPFRRGQTPSAKRLFASLDAKKTKKKAAAEERKAATEGRPKPVFRNFVADTSPVPIMAAPPSTPLHPIPSSPVPAMVALPSTPLHPIPTPRIPPTPVPAAAPAPTMGQDSPRTSFVPPSPGTVNRRRSAPSGRCGPGTSSWTASGGGGSPFASPPVSPGDLGPRRSTIGRRVRSEDHAAALARRLSLKRRANLNPFTPTPLHVSSKIKRARVAAMNQG